MSSSLGIRAEVYSPGYLRRKAITDHFSTQLCWVAATMMSENLCLDCAHKNKPIFKVYCLSGTERTLRGTRKHHTNGAQNRPQSNSAGATECQTEEDPCGTE